LLKTADQSASAYEERYCAFVDILGFSELVAEIKSGRSSADSVRDLLRVVHDHEDKTYVKYFDGNDFRATSISDAVCLSAKPTPAGLFNIFVALIRLTLRLLKLGYFVRGALVKGSLYHDNKAVFGDAFINAYRLESEVVRYPRIMLTAGIVADIESFSSDKQFSEFIQGRIAEADDGPRYIDALYQIRLDLEGAKRQQKLASYQTIATLLQDRFDKARDNPRHFEKVRWFAIYWNSYALTYGVGVSVSNRLGLNLTP